MNALIKIFFLSLFLLQTSCFDSEDNASKDNNHKAITDSKADFKSRNDYIFALSWSPSYCLLDEKDSRDDAQCDKRKKDYRWITHGLWPQPLGEVNDEKDYVKYCEVPTKRVAAQIVTNMFDIMPASGLMNHAWRKHGTCSDMTQKEYFDKMQALYKKMNIAEMLQDVDQSKIFLKQKISENIMDHYGGLTKDNFVMTCRGRFLRELRICLDGDFELRECGLDERRAACRYNQIHVPFEPRHS